MKKTLSIIILFISINLYAQETELEWHTDVSKAIKISMDNEKPLFFFYINVLSTILASQNPLFKSSSSTELPPRRL